ncbi:hypothetical protein [Jeotgalibacillus aurantiacus]|uniref:hypothetical protein n=1 Tax=Jeotgalibacillus aurantiacus TaxID=2763266 RepID=UPI001D0AE433|nr:hypothetical protein [Jeotgalibacillus aurantiacus]
MKVYEEKIEDMVGKVSVLIQKDGRNVEIVIRSRVDSSRLFECKYQTDQPDRPAYYDAERIAQYYCNSNGLTIELKTTNVELPFIGNANNKTR